MSRAAGQIARGRKIRTAVVAALFCSIMLVCGTTATWLRGGVHDLIAHRGSSVAPENTMAALVDANMRGFDFVECDVSVTGDGVPVLLHDPTIDRTSDGSGAIEGMSLEELRKYDFGSWKSDEYEGERIATLSEAIDYCYREGIQLEIDLTKANSIDMDDSKIDTVCAAVSETASGGCVIWGGYDWQVRRVLENDPLASFIVPIESVEDIEEWGSWAARNEAREIFVSVPYSQLTADLVDAAHSQGLQVSTWSLADDASVDRAFALGCNRVMVESSVDSKRPQSLLYPVYSAIYGTGIRLKHMLIG